MPDSSSMPSPPPPWLFRWRRQDPAAARREADARPAELFEAGYWADLVGRGRTGFVGLRDERRFAGFWNSMPRLRQMTGPIGSAVGWTPCSSLLESHRLLAGIDLSHCWQSPRPSPSTCPNPLRRWTPSPDGRAGVRVQVSAPYDSADHIGRRALPHIWLAGIADPGGRAPNQRVFRSGRLNGTTRCCAGCGTAGRTTPDPRRRDWTVRRPGQAALHRLRGPVVLGQGALDHAASAARSTSGRRARPRYRRLPAHRL